jgi:hypothetical protein
MSERISLIFGKTGTGKSTLAKELIKDQNRVIIIDPQREYNETIIFENIPSLWDYIEKNENFGVLSCRFETDLEIDYLFRTCKIIGNLTLVVEEAEIYISPNARSGYFLDLVRYGRHKGVKIIGIARRRAELSADFRGMCEVIYSFKQTEPLDIDAMKKLSNDFNGLENLKDHDFIKVIL